VPGTLPALVGSSAEERRRCDDREHRGVLAGRDHGDADGRVP
jgi:hypothetical protein